MGRFDRTMLEDDRERGELALVRAPLHSLSLSPTSNESPFSSLDDHTSSSYAAFTPNGDNLISCSLSSCIRIWNYHTSRCIKTYTGHTNVKYSSPALVIDPTAGMDAESESRQTVDQERIPEAWILSGSDTSEVCIWDGQSKELLQRLEGHTGESKSPTLTASSRSNPRTHLSTW
jgi:WD40 repeat protein